MENQSTSPSIYFETGLGMYKTKTVMSVHIPSKSYLFTELGEVAVDPYIVIVPVDFSNTPVKDHSRKYGTKCK